jgi:hypothetical protein
VQVKEGRENRSFSPGKFASGHLADYAMVPGSAFIGFLIRATALLLAIPEHEVSEQARRSEREVGLAFSVAYWSPNSDSTAPLLDPRLHIITALGVAQGAIFEHFARSILPARVNEPAEKL